ncbi:aldehyde dehydrogenase family protein [Comamonas sp. JC664]|uniref:aldehyde dehydrogenase family protein n=1 Tax=Comamonas sp. JC664 TaxID=2801917 RepID=UPI00360A1504
MARAARWCAVGPCGRGHDQLYRQRGHRRAHCCRRCAPYHQAQPGAGWQAPAIVLADADLDLAVKAIRDSRIINTGQVCNCAERVYVQAPGGR